MVACLLFAPQRAAAQQPSGQWEFTLAPLYFWAAEMSGEVTARGATVPVFLEFADAVDSLAGAFSFHFEARKGKWGGFSDLNFVRLASDAQFTIPSVAGQGTQAVDGRFELDNVMFEAGGSFLVHDRAQLSVIGGVRTYTVSPKLELTGAFGESAPIDASRTSTDAFVGVTLRPALTPKLRLVSRADIGTGTADSTWNALIGIEYLVKPWIGLVAGYRGYGIDVANDEGEQVRGYDMTHYGPIFGLNFHWGGR
jgi:hypothetical protein